VALTPDKTHWLAVWWNQRITGHEKQSNPEPGRPAAVRENIQ
jgi:hypothetical protein